MTITAEVIKDSISPANVRLTTFQLRYPKFIHGELMTHRVFSRNASSSRAIPVKRLIEDIRRDPAIPEEWGSNKPGMQAGEELSPNEQEDARLLWLDAMEYAIKNVESLIQLGLHKQVANRIIEPWCHINVLVTSTHWANFYALRRHKDAQPEIRVLANLMWDLMEESQPQLLRQGEWHLPYVDAVDPDLKTHGLKCSVARCARVSYLTHERKEPTLAQDLELYNRLVGEHPMHASPAEHQATPDQRTPTLGWQFPQLHGNFTGWKQFRKMLPGECFRDVY